MLVLAVAVLLVGLLGAVRELVLRPGHAGTRIPT
jgi:hypothetical protein